MPNLPLRIAVATYGHTAALKQDARLVALLRNAVEAAAGEDGWAHQGAVGNVLKNQGSFDPRNYGYRYLGDLIEASGLFDLERRNNNVVVLRDKRLARAAKAKPAEAPGSGG